MQNNIREKVMRVEGKVRILVYGLMAGNLSALVLAGSLVHSYSWPLASWDHRLAWVVAEIVPSSLSCKVILYRQSSLLATKGGFIYDLLQCFLQMLSVKAIPQSWMPLLAFLLLSWGGGYILKGNVLPLEVSNDANILGFLPQCTPCRIDVCQFGPIDVRKPSPWCGRT